MDYSQISDRLLRLEILAEFNSQRIDAVIDIILGTAATLIFALSSIVYLWIKRK